MVRPSGFPLSGINLESAANSKKTCLTAGFFVVRPSGFPLSGINLESAANSKKTCLTAGFFVVRPSGFPLSGINLESAANSKKTCLTAGFFVVRPSGFEPLAYRVGVCHSIQLSYGRIFSRSYYSKVRPKSKAGFSVSIRQRICYTEKKATCIGRTHPL